MAFSGIIQILGIWAMGVLADDDGFVQMNLAEPRVLEDCEVVLYEHDPKTPGSTKTLKGRGAFTLGTFGTSSVHVTGNGCVALGYNNTDCEGDLLKGKNGTGIYWDSESKHHWLTTRGMVFGADDLQGYWGCNDCAKCVRVIRHCKTHPEVEDCEDPDQCTCNNGNASVGADCPQNGAEKCVGCNGPTYILEDGACKCNGPTYILEDGACKKCEGDNYHIVDGVCEKCEDGHVVMNGVCRKTCSQIATGKINYYHYLDGSAFASDLPMNEKASICGEKAAKSSSCRNGCGIVNVWPEAAHTGAPHGGTWNRYCQCYAPATEDCTVAPETQYPYYGAIAYKCA